MLYLLEILEKGSEEKRQELLELEDIEIKWEEAKQLRANGELVLPEIKEPALISQAESKDYSNWQLVVWSAPLLNRYLQKKKEPSLEVNNKNSLFPSMLPKLRKLFYQQ